MPLQAGMVSPLQCLTFCLQTSNLLRRSHHNDALYLLWAPRSLIRAGEFTREEALETAESGDLVALGRWFTSNIVKSTLFNGVQLAKPHQQGTPSLSTPARPPQLAPYPSYHTCNPVSAPSWSWSHSEEDSLELLGSATEGCVWDLRPRLDSELTYARAASLDNSSQAS
ncbi:hypothetical protein K438DRAFT_1758716 [Mycena galopus ATCC 62051]|nr:hypothetical protein K438DRAFT_1758716 [Mycena galopus ATCC 62051]